MLIAKFFVMRNICWAASSEPLLIATVELTRRLTREIIMNSKKEPGDFADKKREEQWPWRYRCGTGCPRK